MPFAHWDPVRELLSLQERMNRIIDQTLSRSHSEGELSSSGAWSPAVDLYESDKSLILKAELPEVEQSLAAGRYLEAKSRAESALATAQGVKDQVLAAIALAQGA